MRRLSVDELKRSGTWQGLSKEEQKRRLALEAPAPFEFGMPPRPPGMSPRERRLWNEYTENLYTMRVLAKSDQSLILKIIEAKLLDDKEQLAAAVFVLEQREPFPEQVDAEPPPELSSTPVREIPDATAVAKQYAEDILSGKIVAGKYIKLACQRFQNDLLRQDLIYDSVAAQHVVNYLENLGLQLLPWQIFALSNVFGFKLTNGYRRFRRSLTLLSKKCGKSTLCSGLCLYMADSLGDGEPFPECYIGSTGKSQSFDLVFKMSCRLREQNPDIAARSRKWQSKISFSNGGVVEPLMAASERLNGRNIHLAICDEIADWRNGSLMDVFSSSTVGRRQSLIWCISTAGDQREGQLCWEERAHAIKVLEGILTADADFYLLYELDENDSYEDPANWIKATPSLGVLIDEGSIRDLLKQAQGIPQKLNAFLRYQMNRWSVSSEVAWIDPNLLQQPGVGYLEGEKDLMPIQRIEAAEKRLEIKDLPKKLSEYSMEELLKLPQPRKCFAGLDLSQTLDLSALCLLFPPVKPDGIFECIFRTWCPEEQIQDRARNDRFPYDSLSRTPKILQATPGSVVDNRWIEAEILALHKRFKIAELGFDRRYAEDTCRRLETTGVKVSVVGQGYALSPAIVELQKLLTEGRLCLHSNPIVNFCFQNTEVHRAPVSGDLELRKGLARNRIDCTIACVMAMFIYMQQKPSSVGSGKVSFL